MNSSGDAVKGNVKDGDEVIVIVDQMDLSPGRLKLKDGGASAGHNGLKSMMEALPENFIRLYVGIGRPEEGVSVVDHVLTRFSPEDEQKVNKAMDFAANTLKDYIEGECNFLIAQQKINSYREE